MKIGDTVYVVFKEGWGSFHLIGPLKIHKVHESKVETYYSFMESSKYFPKSEIFKDLDKAIVRFKKYNASTKKQS